MRTKMLSTLAGIGLTALVSLAEPERLDITFNVQGMGDVGKLIFLDGFASQEYSKPSFPSEVSPMIYFNENGTNMMNKAMLENFTGITTAKLAVTRSETGDVIRISDGFLRFKHFKNTTFKEPRVEEFYGTSQGANEGAISSTDTTTVPLSAFDVPGTVSGGLVYDSNSEKYVYQIGDLTIDRENKLTVVKFR